MQLSREWYEGSFSRAMYFPSLVLPALHTGFDFEHRYPKKLWKVRGRYFSDNHITSHRNGYYPSCSSLLSFWCSFLPAVSEDS